MADLSLLLYYGCHGSMLHQYRGLILWPLYNCHPSMGDFLAFAFFGVEIFPIVRPTLLTLTRKEAKTEERYPICYCRLLCILVSPYLSLFFLTHWLTSSATLENGFWGHYFLTNRTLSVDMASFRSAWPRLIWRLQAWTFGVSRLCSKALQGYSRGWKEDVRFFVHHCFTVSKCTFHHPLTIQRHSTTKKGHNCFDEADTSSVDMAK